MVSIDVCSSQLSDEDVTPANVKSKYYYHDHLKPLEVSPLHVVFSLRGVFEKQGKSFKPCTLIHAKWYRNPSIDPYVIPGPNL